jgi:hypothetical protein
LPTVHRLLGKEKSEFDSAEYFNYIIPPRSVELDSHQTIERLRFLPPGRGSSGNAIAVNPKRACLIHWTPAETQTPQFFTMHSLRTPDVHIVASERISTLASNHLWRPLPSSLVMTFPFS